MKSFTYSRDGFEITSHGNGTAYTVRKDGVSFFVQGDDALALETEIEAIDAQETPRYGVRELLADYIGSHGQPDNAA